MNNVECFLIYNCSHSISNSMDSRLRLRLRTINIYMFKLLLLLLRMIQKAVGGRTIRMNQMFCSNTKLETMATDWEVTEFGVFLFVTNHLQVCRWNSSENWILFICLSWICSLLVTSHRWCIHFVCSILILWFVIFVRYVHLPQSLPNSKLLKKQIAIGQEWKKIQWSRRMLLIESIEILASR